MTGLTSVGYFLVTTLFSLITFVLWARLFIRYFAISPFLPFSQSIYQLTNPVLVPVQKYITHGSGARGPYDFACLLLLVLCQFLKFVILDLFFLNKALSFISIALYTIVEMILLPCNILFYAIIIRVVISWVNPGWRNDFVGVLFAVTEPMLRVIRGVLPNVGMFDFSPIVAIIILKVIEILAMNLLPFPFLM